MNDHNISIIQFYLLLIGILNFFFLWSKVDVKVSAENCEICFTDSILSCSISEILAYDLKK